jgi:hypothetical protein
MQQLFVDPPVDGVYTYWCTPDYSQLIRECDCNRGRRRRVPVPVPVPSPQPNQRRLPVPVVVPSPVPEPVPVVPTQPILPPVISPSPVPTPEMGGIPSWVYWAGGAAGVALIIACFASGVCEAAAIAAAFGVAAEEVIAFLTISGGVALRYN